MTTTLIISLFIVSIILIVVSTILFISTLGLRKTMQQELSDWALEFSSALQQVGASDQAISEIEQIVQLNSQEVKTLKEHHNITIKEVQRGFEELQDQMLRLIGPEKAEQLKYKQ